VVHVNQDLFFENIEKKFMSLNDTLKDVVDLTSGMLLGAVPYFTGVQKMMATQRGVENTPRFTEIQMTSGNTYYFGTEVPGKPNALVILITNKKLEYGLVRFVSSIVRNRPNHP